MPNTNASHSARFRGWFFDQVNGTLEAFHGLTRVFGATASALTIDLATSVTGGITAATGAITATVGDVTVTAGNVNVTAGVVAIPLGNVKLGTPGVFATTQPQGAVIMGGTSLTGIAPVGSITTAGAVFASDTVVRKIVASGTASNVET